MITPEDVRQYSEFDTVKTRQETQLKFDIVQAKQDIFKYCGHDFSDYPELPEEVELAFIKLAEYYAIINSDEGRVRGIKSESLGDYSYTIGDGDTKKLSLKSLLDEYVEDTGQKGTKFKMRVL